MPTQLRWIPSPAASALYAAWVCVQRQTPTEGRMGPRLVTAAEEVRTTLAGCGIAVEAFFSHAIPLASRNPGMREVARLALVKTIGLTDSAPALDRVAAVLREVELAATEQWPRLADELAVRVGPLRSMWEGRGPGLLRGIGQRTEPELLPESADVVLVQPVVGGAGCAHLSYNAVTLESMLTNSDDALPEVVRLAWLLSTLQLDLPRYSERIPRGRFQHLARLAMLSPVLESACDVELVAPLDKVLPRALAHWRLAPDAASRASFTDTLITWWNTYSADRPAWHIALAALDAMATDK